jgi:hypothetical protein
VIRTRKLKLHRELIAVLRKPIQNINATCGQNVEFLNVKNGGTQSGH